MRQRVYSVLIDGKELIEINPSGVQARIQFEVTVDALGAITLCDMTLSNLKQETINYAFKRGAVLELIAGYEDNYGYIFKGVIRNVFKGRNVATTTIQVLARGGALEKGVVNISLGENAKLSEILKEVVSAAGFSLVFYESDYSDVYTTGYSITADPRVVLNQLAKAWRFRWAIENDSIIIFRQSQPRRSPTKVINMNSGMEGIPEVTEVGVNFSVRLDPSIRIGSLVTLDTEYKSFNFSGVYYPTGLQDVQGTGEYTVKKIVFSGDNYGLNWNTKVEGWLQNAQEIN